MGLLRGSFLPCLPSMQAKAAHSGSFLHVTWHCEEGGAGGWEELSFGSVPAGWHPEVWADLRHPALEPTPLLPGKGGEALFPKAPR